MIQSFQKTIAIVLISTLLLDPALASMHVRPHPIHSGFNSTFNAQALTLLASDYGKGWLNRKPTSSLWKWAGVSAAVIVPLLIWAVWPHLDPHSTQLTTHVLTSVAMPLGVAPFRTSQSPRGYSLTPPRTLAQENDQTPADTRNEIALQLTRLDANFGFLPENHTLVRHLNHLMETLFPDVEEGNRPKIKILASRGANVNGWVYPDGTIVITPEIIGFAEYVEEEVAVLLHEVMHLRRLHFSKDDAAQKRLHWGDILGLHRFHEYEADAAAFAMMAEKGYNNLGFITFTNRLSQTPELASWGIVHGSPTDRTLNLQSITYLAELPHLSRYLTPIPSEVREAQRHVPYGHYIQRLIGENQDYSRERQRDRQSLGEAPEWHLLRYTLRHLVARIIHLGSQASSGIAAVRNAYDWETDFMGMLLRRYRLLFDQRFGKHSEDIRTALQYFILTVPFEVQLELEKPDFDIGLASASFAQRMSRSFLDTVRNVLDSDLLRLEQDVFRTKVLEVFILRTLRLARTQGIFENEEGAFDAAAFFNEAHALIEASGRLNERMGVGFFRKENLWSHVVFQALEELHELGQNDESTLRDTLRIAASPVYPSADATQMDTFFKKSTVITDREDRSLVRRLLESEGFIFSTKIENATLAAQFREFILDTQGTFKETDPEASLKEIRGVEPKTYDEVLGGHKTKLKELITGHTLAEISNALEQLENEAPQLGLLRAQINSFTIAAGREFSALQKNGFSQETLQDLAAYCHIHLSDAKDIDLYISDALVPYCQKHADSISLETLEQLQQDMNDFSLAQRLNYHGPPRERMIQLNDNDEFQVLSFKTLKNELGKAETADAYFALLKRFLQQRKLIILPPGEFEILQKGLVTLDFSKPEDPVTQERAFLLSYFVQDAFIRNYLQNYLLGEQVTLLPFDDAAHLIFHAYPWNRSVGFTRAVDVLIEEKAATPADFEAVRREFKGILDIASSGSQGMGMWLGMDAFMEVVFKNQERFLDALLASGQDDSALKSYIFDVWYSVFAGQGLRETDFPKKNVSGREVHDTKKMNYVEPSAVLDTLYRMDSGAKYFLLRKLLMGKGGILKNKRKREHFLHQFMQQALQQGNPELMTVISDVLQAITESATDDELYFAIYPLLLDRIGNPPPHPAPWEPIVRKNAEEQVDYLIAQLEYDEEISQELRQGRRSGRLTQHLKRRDEYIQTIESRMMGRIKQGEQRGVHPNERKLFSLVPTWFYQRTSQPLPPEEFVVEMGKNLRNPGIRFLQLILGYVDPPEALRRRFMDVFDDLKGQSKMAAYETCKREMPEVMERVKTFGRRLGGGSMGTVYLIEMDDGTLEAWRVLNPNAEYHTQGIVDLMKRSLKSLVQRSPVYAVVQPLIEGLETWILGDIRDPTFDEDDQAFRKAQQDYQPKGFRFKIHVPAVHGRTEHVMRYEFVPGRDLKDLLSYPPDERREMVALAIQNYFTQLRGSMSDFFTGTPSRVHSDVTIGNLRAMPEHRVAILDRNFYLQIDNRDKAALLKLQQAADIETQTDVLIDYFVASEENRILRTRYQDAAEYDDFKKTIKAGVKALHPSNGKEINLFDTLRFLRGHGFKIPLKIDLLVKNLNNLNRMAKDAEPTWTSLAPALEYQPTATGSWFETGSGWYEHLVAWISEPGLSIGIPLISLGGFLPHELNLSLMSGWVMMIGAGLWTAAVSAFLTRYPHLWFRGRGVFNSAPVRELTWETSFVGFLAGLSIAIPSSLGGITSRMHGTALISMLLLTVRHFLINNPRFLPQTRNLYYAA